MSLRNGESHIPALVVAYLATRRDLPDEDADFELPSSTVLPIVAGPVKATKQLRPCLEVWCPSFELPGHREIGVFQVAMDLHADNVTAQATENTWLAQIRRSFAGGLFQTYLASLSTNDKAGWDLQQFVITGGSIVADDEERRLIRRTTATCRYRSNEFTD